MTFNGAVHSFRITSSKTSKQSFFASPQNRFELANTIKRQLKHEIDKSYIGQENVKNCAAHIRIERNSFLTDIQEYAATQEDTNLDAVYMGQEQSCYNHLIEIHNNIGVYLPTYFFFPILISIKGQALPIFVGSGVKLYTELKQINKNLQAEQNVDLGDISPFLDAGEEDVEDYESSYEGTENFWASFDYIIMMTLLKKSLQTKLPLFIF